ncbi:MAG: hypothetical protein N3E51_05180 [Candidatus Micrarchaeota archaeon]|nr:hypothetical protein [Candidatus Micrarchaeota archaeon]
MASNLPSSFSRTGGASPQYSPPPSPSPPSAPLLPSISSESSLPLLLSGLALLIALIAFYGAFLSDKPLSPAQKAALRGIADDLRALQNRDITLSAPVSTTISLDRSYPIADLFPTYFEIPLSFEIPIDTQLVGISTTGQPVSFRVQETVPIKAKIPISSTQAFGTETIRIKKEMPVEAKFSSTVKVRAAYGQELNGIIDKLEELAR